jgi:hypothetical protein
MRRFLAAPHRGGINIGKRQAILAAALCAAVLVAPGSAQEAARPAEKLLPASTKSFVSVPNVDELRARFDKTQWGVLAKDPLMKPFVEDLNRQLIDRLTATGYKLGLTSEDLEKIYGGEVAIANVQPDPKAKQQFATVLLVDITGKGAEANEVVKRATDNLVKDGAVRGDFKVRGIDVVGVKIPAKDPAEKARNVYYVIAENRLVAVDHPDIVGEVIVRLAADRDDSLDSVEAFKATLARCDKEIGDMKPHLRWFVEPFGYARLARAANGDARKKGDTDILAALEKQGFTAIQGAGGYVFLATGEHELLHHSFVYAPAVKRKPGDKSKDKYDLAARVLDFPNGGSLVPYDWTPRDGAMYGSFNLKVKESFEYSKTLVNEILGSEGEDYFEDILASQRDDPHGPQIDIRKELIAKCGGRAVVLTDYRLPITPESERMLVAIELTDPKAVEESVNRALKNDPDAIARRDHKGEQIIWELVAPENKQRRRPMGAGGAGRFERRRDDKKRERDVPNSAVTVAHGHLMVATHVDFIVDMLEKGGVGNSLKDSVDYQTAMKALEKLGAGEDSFRFFTRTDEEWRPTYELIRAGKMPQSKTMLGLLLNRLLGSGEEGVVRKQEVDPAKMPDFEVARRYLGPSGIYVQSEDDGWYVAGCVLAKE